MALVYPTLPTVGAPHSSEDPKIRASLITLRNEINGLLDATNLADGAVTADKISAALAKTLGITNNAVAGRGYSAVATSQSTSSATYTDLSTAGPSVVVDIATNGFVMLYAEATLTPTTTGAAIVGVYEATDFASDTLILTEAQTASPAAVARRTTPSTTAGTTSRGGLILLPATAGTRTYKLRYARFGGSGSVTFASRKLWVVGQGAV